MRDICTASNRSADASLEDTFLEGGDIYLLSENTFSTPKPNSLPRIHISFPKTHSVIGKHISLLGEAFSFGGTFSVFPENTFSLPKAHAFS